jgi:hypothetical protein
MPYVEKQIVGMFAENVDDMSIIMLSKSEESFFSVEGSWSFPTTDSHRM